MSVTLRKVIEIITSKHTAQLKDRHAAMVRRVCSHKSPYSNGFFYNDMDQVIQLIQLLLKGVAAGESILIDPLCRLINHCKLDFQKYKTSDELTFTQTLTKLLNSLYPLVKFEQIPPELQIVKTVCDFIAELASKQVLELRQKEVQANLGHQFSKTVKSQTGKIPLKTAQNLDLRSYSLIRERGTKNLRAIADTQIPEALVQILADHIAQPEITASAVKAISALSIYTPLALKIGELGALKDLIVVVCHASNFRDHLVNLCIECIWNIMEQSEECTQTLARQELILSLRGALQRVIQQGYKLDDRKLRNELLIIVTSIVALPETHQFFISKQETEESFLSELVKFSSIDQLNLATTTTGTSTNSKKAMWGTQPEDLEFKKLLWTCVARIISSDNHSAIQELTNSDFISALLLYLDPSQANQAINRWQQPQLRQIQLHALYVIFHILPLIPEHFQNQNGNYCLVNFLSAYSDHERKINTLKTLQIASQCDQFKMQLAEQGLFDSLLDIVQSDKDYPLYARELALSIISNACKDCRQNQKEIRRKGWIELIKSNIQPLPPQIVGEGDQFALAVIDCLWHAVLSNKRSTLQFIDIEGVSTLLDYLDQAPQILIRVLISCLTNILKIQRAKTSFIDWTSSKTMINASQLMVRIYQSEEKRLGITYGEDGVLQNPERPLAPPETRSSRGFERLREALEAASQQSEIASIRRKQTEFVRKRDLRASIYACLSLVGFDCNELDSNERKKMEIVRMYPEFRKGELFIDIKNELASLGIQPTSDDRFFLEECIKESIELAQNTIMNQNIIARESKREAEAELTTFYQSLLKTGGFRQLKIY